LKNSKLNRISLSLLISGLSFSFSIFFFFFEDFSFLYSFVFSSFLLLAMYIGSTYRIWFLNSISNHKKQRDWSNGIFALSIALFSLSLIVKIEFNYLLLLAIFSGYFFSKLNCLSNDCCGNQKLKKKVQSLELFVTFLLIIFTLVFKVNEFICVIVLSIYLIMRFISYHSQDRFDKKIMLNRVIFELSFFFVVIKLILI